MKSTAVMTCALVFLSSIILTGCGGGVDEQRPISEVRAEADTMTLGQLESMVTRYERAIRNRESEIANLSERVREIPVAQMMGEEARALKSELDELNTSLRALTERLNIYAAALREQAE